MKKIKVLLVIAFAFVLGVTNVFAEGPNPESSELVVGGHVLFQKGSKTSEELPGAVFNDENFTLTLTEELNIDNGEGIKIIDMGDGLTVLVEGNVNYSLLERNDGLFIVNTKVTIDSENNGSLKVNLEEGSGIIVEGTSELHIQDVGLDVVSIRFKDQVVDVFDTAVLTNTTLYKDGQVIEATDITLPTTDTVVFEGPEGEKQTSKYKRRDSLGDIAVYAIVAGLLVVGGIAVLLITVKNQKNTK